MTRKVPELDQILRDIDAEMIAKQQPILTVLIRANDGSPCHIFWESVEKFGLRRAGETDAQLTSRLEGEAFAFHHERH